MAFDKHAEDSGAMTIPSKSDLTNCNCEPSLICDMKLLQSFMLTSRRKSNALLPTKGLGGSSDASPDEASESPCSHSDASRLLSESTTSTNALPSYTNQVPKEDLVMHASPDSDIACELPLLPVRLI